MSTLMRCGVDTGYITRTCCTCTRFGWCACVHDCIFAQGDSGSPDRESGRPNDDTVEAEEHEALLAETDRLRSKNSELMHLQSGFSARNLHLHKENETLQVCLCACVRVCVRASVRVSG